MARIFLPLLCLACALPADTEVSREYRNRIVKNARLAIILANPVYSDVGYRIDKSVGTGNPDSCVERYVLDRLPAAIKKHSTCAWAGFNRLAPGRKLYLAELDDEEFPGVRFPVPDTRTEIAVAGPPADFLLILHDFALLGSGEFVIAGFLGKMADPDNVRLRIRCFFVLWDVKNRKAAVWGRVQDAEKLDGAAFTAQELDDMIDVIGGDLVEETLLGIDP